jgi:hypothetical protein
MDYKRLYVEENYFGAHVSFDSTNALFYSIFPQMGILLPSIIIDEYIVSDSAAIFKCHVAYTKMIGDLSDSTSPKIFMQENVYTEGFTIYKCSGKDRLQIDKIVAKDEGSFNLIFRKSDNFVHVLYVHRCEMGLVYNGKEIYKYYAKRYRKDRYNEK